jgi:hypothetical protein
MKQISSIVDEPAPIYASRNNPSRFIICNARDEHIIATISLSILILICFVMSMIHIHRLNLRQLS